MPFRDRMPFIQHPASSLQPPASSLQHPASSIQPPASSIQHPTANMRDTLYRYVHSRPLHGGRAKKKPVALGSCMFSRSLIWWHHDTFETHRDDTASRHDVLTVDSVHEMRAMRIIAASQGLAERKDLPVTDGGSSQCPNPAAEEPKST
jgi:hypothetical protein